MSTTFASKWDRRIKAAVLYLVLERGQTATAAHRLAVAGELPRLNGGPDLEPAPGLPIGTVRDWCREERGRRATEKAAAAGPNEVLERSAGRLAASFERMVERAVKQANTGKLEPKRLTELARAGRELEQLTRALSPGSTAPAAAAATTARGPSAAPAAGGFLAGLAREANA